ncbi:MAG: tetratricopeptide repeat protein [bacterium]|nr:tetratricopeptide repeat protein [bacterium]
MTVLKEFSYSNAFQRRIMYFSTFFTFITLGFIVTDTSISLLYYFYYYPVISVVLISTMIGLFTGSLLSRFFFSFIHRFRILYIICEVLFIASSVLYMLRSIILPESREPLLSLFFYSPYSIPVIMGFIAFFGGMKANYFLKIACGDFIDEKQGLKKYIMYILLGLSMGIVMAGSSFLFQYFPKGAGFSTPFAALPLFLLTSLFLLKLQYNPSPLFAQQYKEDIEEPLTAQGLLRDDLVFTYLNFLFIIVYVYLGYLGIIKFYGDLFYVKLPFVAITLFGILIGFIISHIFKTAFWHVYTEMIFPIFFLLFVFMSYTFHQELPFYYGLALFIPASIVFGFSLQHTVSNILINYNHKKRFNIISFSVLVLPIPIIISISFIEFTYLWYFVFIYFLAIINVIFPGIHLINREVKAYKKISYFVFSLVFLPLLIFIHIYFKIPLDNNIYVTKIENFDELKGTNYNSLYIKNKGTVYMNGSPIFSISDNIIRNMKRSLVPIHLYHNDEKKKILFIDSNQKFFRNPMLANFKDPHLPYSLDTLTDKNVDFNELPFSGKQEYVPESNDLLTYFSKNKGKNRKDFFTIVDIPNVMDQNHNLFRFSHEYYTIVKKNMEPKGLFIQIFSLKDCSSSFLSHAVENLKKSFNKHIIYLFSDVLVILSSDDENAFKIDENDYAKLTGVFEKDKNLKNILYNEAHVVSHLLFTEIDELNSLISKSSVDPLYLFKKQKKPELGKKQKKEFYEKYTVENKKILDFIDKEKDYQHLYFYQRVNNDLIRNDAIVTLFKKTGFAESQENYRDETNYLFELKRYTGYDSELREYLNKILSFKEEFYYSAALRLEKDKKWEEAQELYKAILTINSDNFDANYRMGLLCLTLQNINDSFKYLQHALLLKKNDSKVLYQMGVLLFSSRRYVEAINYLDRAIREQERSASIYMYLGLSYEKIGNLNEAEYRYTQASKEDANDPKIKSLLEKIRKKIKDQENRWKLPDRANQMEVEQGEEIPLPINKSAYDIRLKDKDVEKMRKRGDAGNAGNTRSFPNPDPTPTPAPDENTNQNKPVEGQ